MYNYSRVTLMGRLTRDPELRKLQNGKSVATLGIALTETYRNAAGEQVEKPCFVDVETWEEKAENCAKYLRKGRPVLIEGKLLLDEWESNKGERRQKLKVRASMVQFLCESGGSGKTGGDRSGQRPANRPASKDGGRDADDNSPF